MGVRFHGRTARWLLLVTGVTLLACAGGVGGALAAPTSYLLSPAPGSSAMGGGSVILDPMVAPLFIQVNLSGGHPLTTYLVAACANGYGCSQSGASFGTDGSGAFSGGVVTAYPPSLDYVAITDSGNVTDSYVALVNAGPQAYTIPTAGGSQIGTPGAGAFYVGNTPSGPVWAAPDGTILVTGGTQAGLLNPGTFTPICPPGYAGPYTVPKNVGLITVMCPGV